MLFYFITFLLPYLVCYLIQIISLVHRDLLEHVVSPLLILGHHIPGLLVQHPTLTELRMVHIERVLSILALRGAIRS